MLYSPCNILLKWTLFITKCKYCRFQIQFQEFTLNFNYIDDLISSFKPPVIYEVLKMWDLNNQFLWNAFIYFIS